jgi:general secretion pathway protein K
VIIISVLGALGIIYVMVLQLSAESIFIAQYYDRIMFRERSYYIARSALSGVNQIFALSDSSYDSFHDAWAYGLPQYFIDEEQITISAVIEDQERFFNPNSIMRDGQTTSERHLKQFRKLLEILELNPDISNAVIDWIDTDDIRAGPMGADGLDYPPEMPAKGGKLDSLEEMRKIIGLEDEMFTGRVAMGRALPGLKDVLSVHTNGKVNVNTTRSEILLSLDDDMTPEMVDELIRRREEKPFRTMDDLLELPGMNHDLLYRIKHLADVKSENFKITITVENQTRDSADLVVIFRRSGQTGKIVFWQAI